jgi:DNA-binding NtrC family response regulator
VNSAQTKPLAGLNVILVEDQSLIALDTEASLLDLGAREVQTFTGIEAALSWLTSGSPDIGVLDVNLGGTANAFPLAAELHLRRVPFVFTTGYGESLKVPVEMRDAPIVRKPYTLDALRLALCSCLGIASDEGI